MLVESLDGTASRTISVTVTGSNDVPVVSDGTGAVTEDTGVVVVAGTGRLVTGGTLSVVDPDVGQSAFDPASLAYAGGSHAGAALGAMTVSAAGVWSYGIDNSLSAVQALAAGQVMTETWTLRSADGTAHSSLTVTITGTNDLPVIRGQASGQVVEDGLQAVTGQLTVSDIDVSDSHSWSLRDAGLPGGSGAYGTLSVDGSGAGAMFWTTAMPLCRVWRRVLCCKM